MDPRVRETGHYVTAATRLDGESASEDPSPASEEEEEEEKYFEEDGQPDNNEADSQRGSTALKRKAPFSRENPVCENCGEQYDWVTSTHDACRYHPGM